MQTPGVLRSVTVFCGSNAGARHGYRLAAQLVGQRLAERQIRMVYGGGSCGLMGAAADGALAAGGQVVGVIPHALERLEIAHRGLSQLHVVASMHARKALMAELSDGFIALPGGLGTLEELFEVLTWAQLGIHVKPVALLNVAGYFDPLLKFLDRSVDERFLRAEHRALLIHGDDIDDVVERMSRHQPPLVDKWLDLDEG